MHSLAVKKIGRAKAAAAAALALSGIYFASLVGFSLTSREQVLGLNEQKYFCEVDCHEAYSVVNVATTRTLGPAPNQRSARGTFYLVTVKVWFDERTISSRRSKDKPLGPNPRWAIVRDERGRRYDISWAGEQALEQAQGEQPPLNQWLKPGESYTTVLVFDLPSDVRNPRLLIANDEWITRFLIGHENSFFHKKAFFRL